MAVAWEKLTEVHGYGVSVERVMAVEEAPGGAGSPEPAQTAGASVVSHQYGYEDARAFWLSARRDDL